MNRDLRRRWNYDMSHPADRTIFIEYFPLWVITSVWRENGTLDCYDLEHYPPSA